LIGKPAAVVKNLIIVRAGRNSLHPRWLDGTGDPEFDLLIASYENGACNIPTQPSMFVPGRKISGYYEVFQRRPDLLERYDYIALFDDDISATKQDIGRLFTIGREYQLDLFQPALSWDSYFSYAATLANERFRLRYTNIVEMMCPVFRTEHLKRTLPLFGLGYETGIDLLWTRLTGDPWFRYAIVDDVVVRHTRPIGATSEQQGFGEGRYDRQIQTVLDRFGATFRGFVTYAAIEKRGRLVRSRYVIGLHTLALWGAWHQTPMERKYFLRYLTDHTRHCFFRPVNLSKIDFGLKAA